MNRPEPAERLPSARVGSFSYDFATALFRWSAEVAALHGYPPEPMTVDAEVVLSHKHTEDRAGVQELYQEMLTTRSALSSRHRIVDTSGAVHSVAVVSKNRLDASRMAIGLDGFYVDLTETFDLQDGHDFDRAVDEAVDVAVAEFTAHRSIIEQAKGMVMVTYSIPADRAFDVLRWRSQQTNTKIRTLCELIVKRALDEITLTADSRSKFDEILLSTSDHQT
ncbi:PAS and ANTAR domain-containing protein [soil metagenome]